MNIAMENNSPTVAEGYPVLRAFGVGDTGLKIVDLLIADGHAPELFRPSIPARAAWTPAPRPTNCRSRTASSGGWAPAAIPSAAARPLKRNSSSSRRFVRGPTLSLFSRASVAAPEPASALSWRASPKPPARWSWLLSPHRSTAKATSVSTWLSAVWKNWAKPPMASFACRTRRSSG